MYMFNIILFMLCYHNIVISKIIYINNIHYNMYILHIITLIFNDTVINMNSLIKYQ